jgi:hypothetical protein
VAVVLPPLGCGAAATAAAIAADAGSAAAVVDCVADTFATVDGNAAAAAAAS